MFAPSRLWPLLSRSPSNCVSTHTPHVNRLNNWLPYRTFKIPKENKKKKKIEKKSEELLEGSQDKKWTYNVPHPEEILGPPKTQERL